MIRPPDHIFFYGTLMRGFDLRRRTNIDQWYRGSGEVAGRLYDLGSYPVLVPGSGRVRGEVYRMLATAPLLQCVDRVEAFRTQDSERSEYLRRPSRAVLDDGTSVRVWVYVYNRTLDGCDLIETGDYLDYLDRHRGSRDSAGP